MKIDEVKENEYNYILDLSELDKEREKLKGACKVRIFIDEKVLIVQKVYSATKWATNGKEFSLIEIRRASSHQFIPGNSKLFFK